jgi:hypothetical protein
MVASSPKKGQLETPLEVAVRWNHMSCVQLLLDKRDFPDDYLKKLLGFTSNTHIKALIQSRI